MSEPQYYSINISVTKDFLIRTHAHPLLAEIKGLAIDDEFYLSMWKNTPDPYVSAFGGVFGTQFKSVDELQSFIGVFNAMLDKHKIEQKHRDQLLYLIKFYGEDAEKERFVNAKYNRLLDYTRFILDLHKNSEAHFSIYCKNKAYKRIHDPYTIEDFFAKLTLLEKYSEEEIMEYRIQENPGDIISYIRIDVGQTELYVPEDLLFTLTGDGVMKNFDGEAIASILLPKHIQPPLFRYTINYMLKEHEENNTPFYRAISAAPLSADDFKKLYRQYKRKSIKQNGSLLQLGVIVSDYLTHHNLFANKRTIATFLFEYFAVFKLFKIRNPKPLPKDYSDLAKHYVDNGVSSETVRLMMKEVAEVGEI